MTYSTEGLFASLRLTVIFYATQHADSAEHELLSQVHGKPAGDEAYMKISIYFVGRHCGELIDLT